jgi:hypothetical protein
MPRGIAKWRPKRRSAWSRFGRGLGLATPCAFKQDDKKNAAYSGTAELIQLEFVPYMVVMDETIQRARDVNACRSKRRLMLSFITASSSGVCATAWPF